MKKKLILATLLLSLFSFSSCSKEVSVHLDKNYQIDSFIYIDSDELVDLISSKKDFALTLGLKGCESCEIIKPIIKEYINKNHTPFYYIETSEYKEAVNLLKDDDNYSIKALAYSASLVLFDEGKDVKYLEYSSKLYSSLDSFEKTINQYVTKSAYTIINDFEKMNYMGVEDIMYKKNLNTLEELRKLIKNNEKVTILYTWFECPDCSLLFSDFLNQYLEKNNQKDLYVFEVYEIRHNSDESIWTNFKKEFQFDSYREGRVPSFVTYQNENKIDMAVFVNDVIEEKDNQYVITDSFWKEEIIGLSASTQEELRLKAAKKEYQFIENYLNKYL